MREKILIVGEYMEKRKYVTGNSVRKKGIKKNPSFQNFLVIKMMGISEFLSENVWNLPCTKNFQKALFSEVS